MKYIVEFIGLDGKVRWTKPTSFLLAAKLMQLIIPFKSKIIEIAVN